MGFSQKVKEALAYYVYALVDPRDKRIFYIGKGRVTDCSNMQRRLLREMNRR